MDKNFVIIATKGDNYKKINHSQYIEMLQNDIGWQFYKVNKKEFKNLMDSVRNLVLPNIIKFCFLRLHSEHKTAIYQGY